MKHPKSFPTGAEIAQRSGLRVHVGPKNDFDWMNGIITLTADVYGGRDAVAVLVAAHELAHTRQPVWMHLLRFLIPVRWKEEQDAWLFAVNLLVDVSRR